MKINYKEKTYEQVLTYRPKAFKNPKKPSRFFRFLLKFVSKFDLKGKFI